MSNIKVNSIKEKFLKASKLHQSGDFKNAEMTYKKILAEHPNEIDTLHNLSILAIQTNKPDIAVKLVNKVINLQPSFHVAYNTRGIAFRSQNKYTLAMQDFEKAVSINTKYAESYLNLAIILIILKKFEQALSYCNKAIKVNSSYSEAYNTQGIIFLQKEQFLESIKSFDNAIKYNQNYYEAYNNKAKCLLKINKSTEAVEEFKKVIKINPRNIETYINIANEFLNMKKFSLSLKYCEIALNIDNKFEDAYLVKGRVHLKMNKANIAIENYKKCLFVNKKNIFALNGLGNAYMILKQNHEAINFYKKAISINNKYADAHANLGLAHYKLRDNKEAIKHFKISLSNNLNCTETLINLGNSYLQLYILDKALKYYNKAIDINPNYAEAYNNKGNILRFYKKYDEAIISYNTALKLKPNLKLLFSSLMFTKMNVCDWKNIYEDRKHFKNILYKKPHYTHHPFSSLSILNDPKDHKIIGQRFVNNNYPEQKNLNEIKPNNKKDKIILAYISYDFGEHPVTRLINEIIENHNRSKFDVIGIYYGPSKTDEMYIKISKAFDKLINVQDKSDEAISMICRNLKIDIAIDLTGHTKGSRIGIFSFRPAPIQVNFLGFPGTTGAKYIDYIIADNTIIPKHFQRNYTEKIIYLPNSYIPTHDLKQVSPTKFSRKDLNLPEHGFIFCCFNNSYKISPEIFAIWLKILKLVKESVLWLSYMTLTARQNLYKEAEAMGIAKERLIFANKMEKHSDHLSRLSFADLFLDTYPYNAHSTAIDFLSMGVPIITLKGETFASRVGASLLKSLELLDLITNSFDAYEKKAVELATNSKEFTIVKNKLRENKAKKILFNTVRFTRNIEKGYEAAYENYINKKRPKTIEIQNN